MPNFTRISYENPLRIPPQKKKKPNETNHPYYNNPLPSYPLSHPGDLCITVIPVKTGIQGWGCLGIKTLIL